MTKGSTMTKSDLVEAVMLETSLPRLLIEMVLDDLAARIWAALLTHDDVRLLGLGSLVVRDRAAYPGRNPRTGEPLTIAARRTVKFRPSAALRRELGDGAASCRSITDA